MKAKKPNAKKPNIKDLLKEIERTLDLGYGPPVVKAKRINCDKAWFMASEDADEALKKVKKLLPKTWEVEVDRGYQSPDYPVAEDENPPCHYLQLTIKMA